MLTLVLHKPRRQRSELTINDTEMFEHVFKEWMQLNFDKVPPYVQREIKFNEAEYEAISEAELLEKRFILIYYKEERTSMIFAHTRDMQHNEGRR